MSFIDLVRGIQKAGVRQWWRDLNCASCLPGCPMRMLPAVEEEADFACYGKSYRHWNVSANLSSRPEEGLGK